MNWFSQLAGRKESSTTVNASGKKIAVLSSARANQALSERDRPLVVEVELAFACFASKQVRFHDAPVAGDVIRVNEKFGLLVTTIIPNTCEADAAKAAAIITAQKFMPKWVRIDCLKGEWVGEYGL